MYHKKLKVGREFCYPQFCHEFCHGQAQGLFMALSSGMVSAGVREPIGNARDQTNVSYVQDLCLSFCIISPSPLIHFHHFSVSKINFF